MTAELASPFLQILAFFLGGSACIYAIINAIAKYIAAHANASLIKAQADLVRAQAAAQADLAKAQAAALLTEAEAKRIMAIATAADLEAKSKAEVIAAAVKERDASTAERQMIISMLIKQNEEIATTKNNAILANQQISTMINKQNEQAAGGKTQQTVDAHILRRATDTNVATGGDVPLPDPIAPFNQNAPRPPEPAPTVSPAPAADPAANIPGNSAAVTENAAAFASNSAAVAANTATLADLKTAVDALGTIPANIANPEGADARNASPGAATT